MFLLFLFLPFLKYNLTRTYSVGILDAELGGGCDVMVEPEHGNIRCPGHPLPNIGSKYPAGTECHIRCYKGYKLDGHHTRICGKDGRWTGDSPTCVREYEDVIYYALNNTPPLFLQIITVFTQLSQYIIIVL